MVTVGVIRYSFGSVSLQFNVWIIKDLDLRLESESDGI